MGVKIGDKPSLSTGAKAGIAIGAILGFSLIAGAIAVLVLRKRRKAQVPGMPEDVAEMPSHSAGLKRLFRGKWRVEMDGDSQPVEIDSRKVYVVPGPPAELEAPQHEQSRNPSVAARQWYLVRERPSKITMILAFMRSRTSTLIVHMAMCI
jgi:hypothetical protein